MPFSLVYSTLTLYDGAIGSSQLVLTASDSSLVGNGWDNRASSAVVSGGCQWILYDVANFVDRSSGSSPVSPSVIGPGSYPFSTIPTFGLRNNVPSAVCCPPSEGTPAIALFRHHLYFGDMQVIYSSSPHLALTTQYHPLSSLVVCGSSTLEQTTLALWSHMDKVSLPSSILSETNF